MSRNSVLAEVWDERERQDNRWGEQNHPDGTGLPGSRERADFARAVCDAHAKAGTVTWLDILNEEVYEAFEETNPVTLRTELLQVAAVAVAWVEAIDRRNGESA